MYIAGFDSKPLLYEMVLGRGLRVKTTKLCSNHAPISTEFQGCVVAGVSFIAVEPEIDQHFRYVSRDSLEGLLEKLSGKALEAMQ